MSSHSSDQDAEKVASGEKTTAGDVQISEVMLNGSGHQDELDRNFSLGSLCGIGIVVGSVAPALLG